MLVHWLLIILSDVTKIGPFYAFLIFITMTDYPYSHKLLRDISLVFHFFQTPPSELVLQGEKVTFLLFEAEFPFFTYNDTQISLPKNKIK